jgi:hypothetical protein
LALSAVQRPRSMNSRPSSPSPVVRVTKKIITHTHSLSLSHKHTHATTSGSMVSGLGNGIGGTRERFGACITQTWTWVGMAD